MGGLSATTYQLQHELYRLFEVMQSDHGRDHLKHLFACIMILSKDVCLLGFFLDYYFIVFTFDEPDSGVQKHCELEGI